MENIGHNIKRKELSFTVNALDIEVASALYKSVIFSDARRNTDGQCAAVS
jgi:hypothetical protein